MFTIVRPSACGGYVMRQGAQTTHPPSQADLEKGEDLAAVFELIGLHLRRLRVLANGLLRAKLKSLEQLDAVLDIILPIDRSINRPIN
jgi:hypothetical protein